MSYIDGFKHEIIGLFGSVPVYRPLEDLPYNSNGWEGDFACSTGQLVIGGGSGEHPGLVLLDPARAVADFAYKSGDFDLSDQMASHLSDLIGTPPHFNFAGWSTENYYDYHMLCTTGSLPNPFDPDGESSLEHWLHLGFGEFIYYAMPQLAYQIIGKISPLHIKKSSILFNNITIIPPNMPVDASNGNAFFRR